ncbi:9575_t:CDS:2 [Ambispora gerdemannii]|uniref:9575_t:CDS:1 n=1 Tax=Ambispora gerdemannii TaxID=144530 RepID=A0A9N9EYJ5_9GLOM|nr:9575_t:CDS:2 [Ambispora gerdemannii]
MTKITDTNIDNWLPEYINAVFPSVNLVSVPGEWKPPGPNDQRSPCPALNVLANHGYIPRDGNNVTVQQIRDALDEHLGVSSWFGSLMARVVMHKFGNNGQLSLADLFEHNIIEHDASLTRNDKYFSTDANPSTQLNQTLITQLLSFASPETNRLNVDSLAKARNLRYDQSKTANPEFVFESDQHSNAFGEASLLLNVIGADEREVEVDVANVFLREAKIPDNWKPGKDKVTMWMAYRLRGRISSRANDMK